MAALGLLGAPALARAASNEIDERTHWTGSVGLLIGAVTQMVDGTVVSTRRPDNAPGQVEGRLFSADKRLLDPYFGLGLELMAPALTLQGGGPQPFVHLDVLHQFGLEIDVVREGSPTGFTLADFGTNVVLDDGAVAGQGMKTEVEYKSPTLALGLGLSFTVMEGFRLRPSVDYLQQRVEMNGLVLDAEGDRIVVDGIVQSDFTYTTLRRNVNRTHHGLGGGLELEWDALRQRWGTITVATGVHVYHLLGEHEFEFTSSNAAGESATWGGRVDPLVWRGGIAVRYRFLAPWEWN